MFISILESNEFITDMVSEVGFESKPNSNTTKVFFFCATLYRCLKSTGLVGESGLNISHWITSENTLEKRSASILAGLVSVYADLSTSFN